MKLKTRKSVSKRIIIKNIFFKRKKAYKAHLLRKKSSNQLRRLAEPSVIHKFDFKIIKLMLPYAKR